jgi:hypothetical protein
MNPSQNPIKILFIASVLLLVFTVTSLIINTNQAMKKTTAFMKRELSGVLVAVKDVHRGTSALTIKEHRTGELFEYDLEVSKFLRENDIGERDSISKDANSGKIIFYKVNERGVYAKCCELQYY